MPRIPRRRKESWERSPEPEQAGSAAASPSDDQAQPTQRTSGDPLAAGAPAPDAPTSAMAPLFGDPLQGAGTTASAEPATSVMPVQPPAAPTDGAPAATPPLEGASGAAAAGPVAPPASGSAPTPEATAEAQAAAASAEHGALVEQAPDDARPNFRERTRMRRRLRYLRRLRELAFRDLGGLVFDLHRFGRERGDLVAGKVQALAGIDHELRTIEAALRERTEYTDLREAGIAACPRCGTLHDTDANFCPGCGTSLRSAIVRDASPVTVTPADESALSAAETAKVAAAPTASGPVSTAAEAGATPLTGSGVPAATASVPGSVPLAAAPAAPATSPDVPAETPATEAPSAPADAAAKPDRAADAASGEGSSAEGGNGTSSEQPTRSW